MEQKRKFWQLSPLEVVCAIAISGILGAIALPSLLGLKGCACADPEGKSSIGSMNRAQQAYAFQYEHFATAIVDLRMGLSAQTENYHYSLRSTPLHAIHYAIPRQTGIKGYVGIVVFISGNPDRENLQTAQLICETKQPKTTRPPKPIFKNNALMCPPGTKGYTRNKSPEIKIRDRDWQLAYQSLNLAESGERDRALQLANTIKETKVKEKTLDAIAGY